MNWGEEPQDMDLHAFQVNKENSHQTCLTYWDSRNGCDGLQLDLDNRDGGLNGAETITFTDMAINKHYSYMVFVHDYSNRKLKESDTQVTFTDGTRSFRVEMPDDDIQPGAEYWFVGCVKFDGNSWTFEQVDTFSIENPHVTEPKFCHDEPPPPPRPREPTPIGTIKVTVRNALTNAFVSGATASLVFKIGEEYDMVVSVVTSDRNGYIEIPIFSNGDYEIEVKADGFITDETKFTVACEIGYRCTLTKLISLSPVMPRGDLRLIMNWDEEPLDLDINSYQVNTKDRAEPCITNFADKNSCEGVRLDLDNRQGGNMGPETITYNSIADYDNYFYMIFIDDYSNIPDQFKDSAARITITDGVQTIRVNIVTKEFAEEKFWLAGCLRSKG